MKESSKMYNVDYYEDGERTGKSCYENYRWLPDLTIPMVLSMINYLGIDPGQTLLDFGCAKGYLVKAFRETWIESYGVDVSSYAIENAPLDMKPYLRLISPGEKIPLLTKKEKYDWFIAKDVLEHVEEKDVHNQLLRLGNVCKRGFAVIPLGDGNSFVVPDYEKDITHSTRQPLAWWVAAFDMAGFKIERACYEVTGIKENWSKWKKGNGFIEVKVK